MAEPITLGGIAVLAISNIGMWIREWRKHSDWKNNNGSMKALETSLTETNKKIDNLLKKFEKSDETLNKMHTAQAENKVRVDYIVTKVNETCTDQKKSAAKLATYEVRRAELVGWGQKEFKGINGRLKALEGKTD